MEAKLCFIGHGLMENRSDLIVDARLTRVSGHAESRVRQRPYGAQRMVDPYPLLKIDIREQLPRLSVQSPHRSLDEFPHRENHARGTNTTDFCIGRTSGKRLPGGGRVWSGAAQRQRGLLDRPDDFQLLARL